MKRCFFYISFLCFIFLSYSSCEEMALKTLHYTSFVVFMDETTNFKEVSLRLDSSDVVNGPIVILNQDYKDSDFYNDIEQIVHKKGCFQFFPFQAKETIEKIHNIEMYITVKVEYEDSEKEYEALLKIPKLQNVKGYGLHQIDFLLKNLSDENDVLEALFTYDLWMTI